MTKVSDIFAKLNEHAPVELKMGFDNVGQLAGRSGRTVDRVLVSLDITDAVIEEARTMGAQLIVSHHPLTFEGLKRVTDAGATERKFLSTLGLTLSKLLFQTFF